MTKNFNSSSSLALKNLAENSLAMTMKDYMEKEGSHTRASSRKFKKLKKQKSLHMERSLEKKESSVPFPDENDLDKVSDEKGWMAIGAGELYWQCCFHQWCQVLLECFMNFNQLVVNSSCLRLDGNQFVTHFWCEHVQPP